MAPVEVPPTEIPLTGTAIATEIPLAETVVAELVTTGDAPIEAVLGEVTSTEVATIATSVPPGNNRNISLSDHFSDIVSDFNNFVETPAASTPSVGMSYEEAVVPPVLDPVGLDYSYHSVIQHQNSLVIELSLKVGMESVPSTWPVPEQIEFVSELTAETSSAPDASPLPTSAAIGGDHQS